MVFFWNRLELLLLSCSCTTHRRSFFYSRILFWSLCLPAYPCLFGHFTKKATEEINVREQHAGRDALVARKNTGKLAGLGARTLARSLTRYADAPEGSCRRDTRCRPRLNHALGRSNGHLVSWSRVGVTLAGLPAFKSFPARVVVPSIPPKGVREPARHVLGVQSNCRLSRERSRSCLARLPVHHSGIER